ncbi:MAG TPA: hypothetical protein VK619_06615 [Pyrinomonadaceae bacterium]|nr:hypothetical protein [Pyrinomonadaceae bacterium]
MKSYPSVHYARRTFCFFFSLLLAFVAPVALAQSPAASSEQTPASSQTQSSEFRLERIPVAGGAELLTIFGTLDGLPPGQSQTNEVPLVSVLRDTLGDSNPENDRLRYLWTLTYARPSFGQRIAAAIPFLYSHVGNRSRTSGTPPPVIDLASTERETWNNIFWLALQNILFDPYGIPVKISSRTYRHNLSDYRKAHVIRALAILSLYQDYVKNSSGNVFTPTEMQDIQARLMLTERAMGGVVDDIHLRSFFQKQRVVTRDNAGHNWELLRQRAEAERLYFEPLEMPDGTATHAIVWVAREDLERNQGREFHGRFLNISNPWTDARLKNWDGYTEVRYFDEENRQVEAGAQGARRVELIPLALYGLDHPKIPALLVDFRDRLNPKKREMSRRIIQDVTRNILSLSKFGDLPYFLGRTVFDFVTGRRGMDVNQPSRLRTYSQLKLLLSLDSSFNPQFREEIEQRLESVSLNPMENDYQVEASIARQQYRALLDYAQRPEGLPARLDRDRREEMMPLKHGRTAQTFFRLANVMTFGLYTHRERSSPEMEALLDLKRRVDFHMRFLREVARSSPRIEIVWNIEDVRHSLQFLGENAQLAGSKTANAAALVFARTEDEETRQLCLNNLYRINNETARSALLHIYREQPVDSRWRALSADYLRKAVREDQRIAPSDARTILSMVGQ